jgi:hypothetical protein
MFSTAFSFMNRLDPNAQAFITAAGITSTSEQNAINGLVIGLKSFGLWNLMKAVYPFAGSTATTHKWNLKDPRDLDAAYRLTFFGGWTHGSTGATPNGTNGYAETHLTPSTHLSTNSTHLSIYLSTNNASIVPSADPIEIGAFNSTTQALLLQQGYATTINTRNLGAVVSGAQTNRLGLGITSKTSATVTTVYKNGVSVASGNSGGSLPTFEIWIGNANLPTTYAQGWTNNTFVFSSIGSSLTSTDASNLYTLVQAYQTALSRQV